MHRFIRFPDATALLPLRYYGSISYYALMAACGKAVIGTGELFDKRDKSAHRCTIADTNGELRLTVPVTKPHGIPRARWTDVGISSHGEWWHNHRVSLESAYGRTPFFEFYIDRLLPFLDSSVCERYHDMASLDIAIDAEIRRILFIETEVSTGTFRAAEEAAEGSESILLTLSDAPSPESLPPYYQVRALTHGFMPGMSVLDLIFNLGPEAPLYLRQSAIGYQQPAI
ncbi:MAG: WbqC family protein [Bacteroidales bacterium]|nr:WbqC family protein [Bacteroidales bacterium]